MNTQENKPDHRIIQRIELIKELSGIVETNYKILDLIKTSRSIDLNDKEIKELLDIHKVNQKHLTRLCFEILPSYFKSKEELVHLKIIKQEFLRWTFDLEKDLKREDHLLKEYLKALDFYEEESKKAPKEKPVKDKRFWKFLDKISRKEKVFTSFEKNNSKEDGIEDAKVIKES